MAFAPETTWRNDARYDYTVLTVSARKEWNEEISIWKLDGSKFIISAHRDMETGKRTERPVSKSMLADASSERGETFLKKLGATINSGHRN